MGATTSAAQLIDYIGTIKAARLTADTGDTPDDDKVNSAIDEAERELWSYVSIRYAVPVDLTLHPGALEVLRIQTKRLATHILYMLRGTMPPANENDREHAIDWLEALAKGDVNLPTVAAPAATESVGPAVELNYQVRTSGRENLQDL